MTRDQVLVALLMALIATVNLAMSFARTHPDEALKNLAAWFERVRKTNIPAFLNGIVRSPLWRVFNAIVLLISVFSFLYPILSFERSSRPPLQSPVVVSSPPNEVAATAPPTTIASRSEPSATSSATNPDLSQEELAIKTSIWESVLNSHANLLTEAYNALDLGQGRWNRMLETPSQRQQLYNDLTNAIAGYVRASNELETLRSFYPNYPEISAALHQPNRASLEKAVSDFAGAVSRTAESTPPIIEVQLRPLAGALRREMDATVRWLSTLRQVGERERRSLAEMK